VVVLSVHAWAGRESKKDVKAFVDKHKITYPVLLGGRTAHKELYKCKYVPRTFFIDRNGRIASTKLGFDPGDEKQMEKIVRDLL
jgi:peroxiredoxin